MSGARCRSRGGLDLLGRPRQCPIPLVGAHLVVAIILRWVAVDHLAIVERVGAAADFVLDREQMLAGVEADDVLPAILVLIAFFGDQAALFEFVMRARKFLHIDLEMVAVEFRQFLVGLAEDQFLLIPGTDMRSTAFTVLLDARRRVEYLAVEARDAVRGSFRHGELDIAHAEIDRADGLTNAAADERSSDCAGCARALI